MKRFLIGAATLALLMIAGSLLHIPQWVAKAAAIYSSPMAEVQLAYRTPYNSSQTAMCISGFCPTAFPAAPAGHRLVVQNISFNGSVSNASIALGLLFNSAGIVHGQWFGVSPIAGKAFLSQPTLAYFDALDAPNLQLQAIGPGSSATSLQATLTGYIENCSAYPGGVCPAIQQ